MKTTLSEAAAYYKENDPRGEYILVLHGADPEALMDEERAKWEDIPVPQHIQQYIDAGMTKKEAIKQVSLDRGVPKREIYNISIENK